MDDGVATGLFVCYNIIGNGAHGAFIFISTFVAIGHASVVGKKCGLKDRQAPQARGIFCRSTIAIETNCAAHSDIYIFFGVMDSDQQCNLTLIFNISFFFLWFFTFE